MNDEYRGRLRQAYWRGWTLRLRHSALDALHHDDQDFIAALPPAAKRRVDAARLTGAGVRLSVREVIATATALGEHRRAELDPGATP